MKERVSSFESSDGRTMGAPPGLPTSALCSYTVYMSLILAAPLRRTQRERARSSLPKLLTELTSCLKPGRGESGD